MITVFVLTSKCNLDCQFCLCNQEPELSTDYVKNKLRQCSGTVIFTGGEPLLKKDINDLCKYAKERNLTVGVHTNGILFSRLDLTKVDFVSLPIDGKENTHNQLRKSNYVTVIKAINLAKNKVDLRIATIATKINLSEIKDIPSIIKNHNIRLWRIFKYKGENKKFQISNHEFNQLKKIKTTVPTEFIEDIDNFGNWKKIN